MTNALTLLVFSACLGACAPGIPEIPPPASSVTRREALAASRAYTSMIWRGSSPECPPRDGRGRHPDRHAGRLRSRI